jgi:hypothetical protein
MSINASRHQSIFDPVAFDRTRVDVIGCGAIGSRVAWGLLKLGVSNLHVWDFDLVESHNVANQIFGNDDVGMPKAEALKKMAESKLQVSPTVHLTKVEGGERLGRIVMVLTDTMSSRAAIWKSSIRLKPGVTAMIEARMGVEQGRVYAVQPCDSSGIKEYEGTLYSDEQAQTSACGSPISVGPTAEVMSGLIQWSFIQAANHCLQQSGEFPCFETILGFGPETMVISRHLST